MDQKTVNDKILMVNSEGRVLGASASCAVFLEQELEQLTGVYILDLNFGLTLTQFLAYFEKLKKDKNFAFKTYFINQENRMIHLDVSAVYMDSQELALLHINQGAPEEVKNYFSDPKHLLMEFPSATIELSLGEVMDATLFQNIMDYFYELTGIPVGIIDMNGNIIVKEGWQDICVKFHRVNPAACKNCLESDYEITKGIAVGEYRAYKCKNNLWDIATPIYIGNQRMGHIYLGQFFYTDEPIDYEYFRKQAQSFGFDEEAYLAALAQVPRFTHQQVETAMNFYTKMASYVSQLSFTNLKIRKTMDELYNVMNFQNALMDAVPSPIFYKNKDLVYLGGNKAFERATGQQPSDYIGKTVFDISPKALADAYHQADVELLETKTPQVYDFQIETPTGEKRDVIFNKAVFNDLTGEAAGIIGVIQDITEMKQAEKYLQKVNEEIIETQKEVIYTLGEIIETRSKEAAKHVVRVAEYSYLIGIKYGLNQDDAMLLKIAAPMHDIGKIGIPDHILNKPGALTREEFECIKTHTTIGYDILKKSNHKIMKMAGIIALSHHERWDGTGYPNGTMGQQINVFSRIVSVADVFDAISHRRCYKEAWPLDQVKEYLFEQKGQMFDPRIIDLFFENWQEILDIRSEHSDEK
jgi:PAS domain S-box-containing protein